MINAADNILGWGSFKENAEQAHGHPVDARNEESGAMQTFASKSEASKKLGISSYQVDKGLRTGNVVEGRRSRMRNFSHRFFSKSISRLLYQICT